MYIEIDDFSLNLLKFYRIKSGMTQKELALLSGVSRQTIQRIETGANTPSLNTIDRISEALALSFRDRQLLIAELRSSRIE